ncbi:MAG: hypothetical protein ABEJ46_01825, partial [Gemmatimonadota bacterium]
MLRRAAVATVALAAAAACCRAEGGMRLPDVPTRPGLLRGAAAAGPAPPDTSVRTTVPFRFDSGNVFVSVMINGTGPHEFLVETGSPVTVLDRGVV